MRRTLLLLSAALILLVSCRTGSAPGASPAVVADSGLSALTPAPRAGDGVPRLSADELWQRLQSGEATVVVDARSLEEYEAEHIAGSISMPAAELAQRAEELPRDRLLVFY